MNKSKRWIKPVIKLLAIVFVAINVIAFMHSYRFTHFSEIYVSRTGEPGDMSTTEKIKTLINGVRNPRPFNNRFPDTAYETITLNSNKKIETWFIKAEEAKGTVILFHGYSSTKSALLGKAALFRTMGYNTMLVDFMGSGGSEGNQCTIGYLEAEQVKTCYDYLKSCGEKRIYLFGSSMGAVAIMKAVNDYKLKTSGIILECPFGSMYKTVSARFRIMNIPEFPMAGLLVFWGGVQNGFWAFHHNPETYAKNIDCPALLLYGAKDKKVSRGEIDRIYHNLQGLKKLSVYSEAGHEDYLKQYKPEWIQDVKTFIK